MPTVRLLITTALLVGCGAVPIWFSAAAQAEEWPALDELASPDFLLIVHIKAEEVQGWTMYKVLDVWKGEYSPQAFAKRPPTGYINTTGPEGDAEARKSGVEAVLFYSRHNQPKEGISRHDMIVPISDGKLTYPPGVVLPFSGQREYTVEEFKREIASRAEESTANRSQTNTLAEAPILSLMIERADVIARVKAHLFGISDESGVVGWSEYLQILEPLKGTIERDRMLGLRSYVLIGEPGRPESEPQMRLPVEKGKEYIAFLKQTPGGAKSAYMLLDPWAGVLADRPEIAQLVRQEEANPVKAVKATSAKRDLFEAYPRSDALDATVTWHRETGEDQLRMTWFLHGEPQVAMRCLVDLSKYQVTTFRDVYDHAIQSAKTRELSHSQALTIGELLRDLPSSEHRPALKDLLTVSFVEDGKQSLRLYDRSKLPRETLRLYDLTGALPPDGKSDQNPAGKSDPESGDRAGVQDFSDAPILSLMVAKADAIAHVKAVLACRVLRLGEEQCREYLQVIEPLKGTVRAGQQLLKKSYTRRTIDGAGQPLPDPGMRLPVENGKEYVVFLRAGQPEYILLDPWAGTLPYRPELAQAVRNAVEVGIRPEQDGKAAANRNSERPDDDAISEIDRLNDQGFSQLHSAAIAGNAETARQLLEQGANPNIRQGKFRGTPLQYAAARGHLEVVRLLLKYDAKVDAADNIGRTPLMWAAMEGRTPVVQALLKAGADTEAATATGWTATRYALDRGHHEVAKLLGVSGPEAPEPRESAFDEVLRVPEGGRTVLYFSLSSREEKLGEKLAALSLRLDDALEIVEKSNGQNIAVVFLLRFGPQAPGFYTSFTHKELKEITALPANKRSAKLWSYAWAFGEPEVLKHRRILEDPPRDAKPVPRRPDGKTGAAEQSPPPSDVPTGPPVESLQMAISDTERLKLLKPVMNLEEVNRLWQGKPMLGQACGTAANQAGKEQGAYWNVYLLDLPDAKEPLSMKFGYIQVEPPYLFEFSGPGFRYRLQDGKYVRFDATLFGRLVSSQYEKLGGHIERSIIRVAKDPGIEEAVEQIFTGNGFQLHLPAGRYRILCSANGSRGATFQPVQRQFEVRAGDPELDLGEIDLPISKTTSLYGQPAPELEGIVAWKNTEPLALKDLRGKAVVLDFFAYYCSICHAHKPDLAKLQEKYAGQGLVVLALHNSSLATLAEMNEKMDPILRRVFRGPVPKLPMALDGSDGKSIFGAYGIRAVPAVILIDREGRVVRRFHHAGVPELEVEVRRLLKIEKNGAAEQPDGQPGSTEPAPRSETDGTMAAIGADREIKTLQRAHIGPITSVAFTPDGRLLATAAMHERGGHAPNLVKLFNPETGELLRTLNSALNEHSSDDVVSAMVFSPDGGKLAVSGGILYHGNVVLFDVKTGKVLWSHQDIADTTDVGIAFSPDGRWLASTGVARNGNGSRRIQRVNLWDVATGKLVRTLDGHDRILMAVAFSPDGKTLASASSNGAVDLWDLQTGEVRQRLRSPDHDPRASGFVNVIFSRDGKRLAVSHSDGALRLWNPENGTLERELPLGKRRPRTIAFSPDGELLANGNWEEESISLWSVRTGKELAVIPKEHGGGTVSAFSPDGKMLATGSRQGAVRLVPIDLTE